jgi:hypothetical protein
MVGDDVARFVCMEVSMPRVASLKVGSVATWNWSEGVGSDSTNPGVLTAAIAAGVLTLTALAAGASTVVLMAADGSVEVLSVTVTP